MSYDNTAPRHSKYSHSIGKQWNQSPGEKPTSYVIEGRDSYTRATQKQDGSWDVRGHGKGGGSNPPHLGGSGGARVPLQPKPKSPAGGAALTVGK